MAASLLAQPLSSRPNHRRSARTYKEACSDCTAEVVPVAREGYRPIRARPEKNYLEVEVSVSISSKVSFSLRK